MIRQLKRIAKTKNLSFSVIIQLINGNTPKATKAPAEEYLTTRDRLGVEI